MEKPAATSLAIAKQQQHQQQSVLRLPPGFRFHPTDEELVVQYLKRKAFSCPLPAAVIPEIDIGKYNPWDLPGGFASERYFFVVRETKYPNGSRANRATGSGYWKATGRDRPIVGSKFDQTVGMKKTLVFYRGKPPAGLKTDWIMHEYRLAGSETRACVFPQRKNSTHSPTAAATRDWVLCRVFMKKRAIKTDSEQAEELHEDCRAIGFPSSPSNSQSSCVTELSDGRSSGTEDISSPP